jgi:HK97 family phage major capsid protein
MDIDVKVAGEIKKEMDKLGASIDEKLDAHKAEIEKAGDASLVKMADDLKGELAAEIAKFNELNEKFTERLDLIETKAGKFSQMQERKNMGDIVMQKLADADVAKNFKARGNVSIDLTPEDLKGLKQDDMTGANTFTGNVPGYDKLPEIHFDPDRKARARDLILQGTTSKTAIEYTRETAFTDNTGTTAEGAEWKQNDFDLTAATAVVRKITNYIILSEEMLDDVEGMTSYILARLPSKINKEEDEQILEGGGTGTDLSGLVTNATAYSDNLADSNVQRIDVLADAVRQLEVGSNNDATGIVVHPNDFYKIVMTKESTYGYVHPWILMQTPLVIAGVPVMSTTAITEGDFLVLSRMAAQVFFRKQMTIEFSNQNEDNFVKGMVTVRAHKRLALPIYSPASLITGDFAVALAQGTA